MAQAKKDASAQEQKPRKDRATEIANTFEWLITAFILAFVFRAFVMEAFRIPTGSMADTLRGAHFRLRCAQCGYKHHRGFNPQLYGFHQDTVPADDQSLKETKCPNCGYFRRHQLYRPIKLPVQNGDRILVLKCLYQFFEPKRWDVIVFKNPQNPLENYIKRLIGLPGEKIEIVDGDIFVNNQIARKPPMVQREVWMPIYDNDYQPVHPEEPVFNNTHTWENPFSTHLSQWTIKEGDPTRFHLDTPIDSISTLAYGTAPSANDYKAVYAYNNARTFADMPDCSDLMIRCYVSSAETYGEMGLGIAKYGKKYTGRIYPDGRMVIFQETDDDYITLAQTHLETIPALNTLKRLQFACVDQQLILAFAGNTLTYDLGTSINSLDRQKDHKPQVWLLGSGRLTLAHVGLYRDIYYTSHALAPRQSPHATEGRPFQLDKDEFFVLGDNSPNSEDGRWWDTPLLATKGQERPRAGVVPRRYLVGKAMYVYWPSGFRFPWPQRIRAAVARGSDHNRLLGIVRGILNLRWIPNIGEMRFIYGGSANTSSPPTND